MERYVLRPERMRFRMSLRPPRGGSERAAIPVAEPPRISRNEQARLDLAAPGADAEIAYTLDGTRPGPDAPLWDGSLTWPDAAQVRAVSVTSSAGPL